MRLWTPGFDRSSTPGSSRIEACVAAWNVANDIPQFEILEISDKTCPIDNPGAFPISKGDSPLRHQNQPPDGTAPLRRR
jgi:hypothetical protein